MGLSVFLKLKGTWIIAYGLVIGETNLLASGFCVLGFMHGTTTFSAFVIFLFDKDEYECLVRL